MVSVVNLMVYLMVSVVNLMVSVVNLTVSADVKHHDRRRSGWLQNTPRQPSRG